MTLQKLDPATSALVALATAIALGDEALVEQKALYEELGYSRADIDKIMAGTPRG